MKRTILIDESGSMEVNTHRANMAAEKIRRKEEARQVHKLKKGINCSHSRLKDVV